MARCITFAVARICVENRRNFAYFSLWHPKYGRQGIQKGLHGSKDRYIYLQTKFGCDRSIVVSCRSCNDRQTDRQTEWNDNKAHSLRCKRDATNSYGAMHQYNLPILKPHSTQLLSSRSACLGTIASQYLHLSSLTFQLSQTCHQD